MPSKFQLRRGSWTVTLAVSAAALVYLFCSFLPTARAIRELRSEIRAREDFIAKSTSLPSAIVATQRELDQVSHYTARRKEHLPAAVQVPALLERMTRTAEAAGTSTTHFEPQTPRNLQQLRLVPILFGVHGGYGQICRMLAELERLPERIWVDELRLEAPRETGQQAECNLKLIIFAGNSEKSN